MSGYHVHAMPVKARRGHQIPGIGVTYGCEPPCACWELNPGTLNAESALQSSRIKQFKPSK